MRALYALSAIAICVCVSGIQRAVGQSEDCRKTLETHGFLSRAQFQCGFKNYSDDMIAAARDCSRRLGAAEAKEQVSSGMEMFDYNEQKRGHAKMCSDVARDMSRWLQP